MAEEREGIGHEWANDRKWKEEDVLQGIHVPLHSTTRRAIWRIVMDINIFMASYDLFCKAVPPLEHVYVIIVVLTVEHISIIVWLKSHQQIIYTERKSSIYGPGLGISSPTKLLILTLTHACSFRCIMDFPQLMLFL